MNALKITLLFAVLTSAECRCQSEARPITLTPLIGDTLDAEDEEYFGLFNGVTGFQWAVFSVDSDAIVTAKICFEDAGNHEFALKGMGSLPLLRKQLADRLKSKKVDNPWQSSLYAAVSIAKLPDNTDGRFSGRSLSGRFEFGYDFGAWAAIGVAADAYDPTQKVNISFIAAFHSPKKFCGFAPYAYYNPRPLGELFRSASNFRQAIGFGVMLPLGKRQVGLRAGGIVLFTSVDDYRPVYAYPYSYPVAYEPETVRKALFIAELSLEFYMGDF